MINSIEAHPFEEPGGLYLAATRYKTGRLQSRYLYKTTDYGKTWKRIDRRYRSSGPLHPRHPRRSRTAPACSTPAPRTASTSPSTTATSWQSLQLELPIVPITDLAVKNQDLVAATQGRSYWILDDLTVLHQMSEEIAEADAHLFEPRPAYRLGRGGGFRGPPPNTGSNPPNGAVFHYLLAETPDEETDLELEILEQNGDEIVTYTRKPAEEKPDEDGPPRGPNTELLETEPGLNRFAWNLRYPPMDRFPGMILWNDSRSGPTAVPGTYKARLTVGEWTQEVDFEVAKDPRSRASQADFQAQFDFVVSVRDKLTEVHQALGRIKDARGQLEALEKRLKEREGMEDVVEASKALREGLTPIEEALYQTKNRSRQDPLNFPVRLNDKLSGVMQVGSFGDTRPTTQATPCETSYSPRSTPRSPS